MTEADLIHFVNAQSDVYNQVTDELTKGRKRTHWMWLIFPQYNLKIVFPFPYTSDSFSSHP